MAATRAICSLPATSFDCFSRRFSTTCVDGLLDPAAQGQRVGAGGHVLQPLANDDLGEQGRRRGAVAGHVVGRRGDLAHELGALVLEDVLDLDLTSDRDAVVGDGRRAELFVEHDVTAFRAEGDLDRVGDGIDARLKGPPRLLPVLQLLVSHVFQSSLVL